MARTFDDILTQLGTGRWNLKFFAAISYAFFLNAHHELPGPFLSPPLDYSCIAPMPYPNSTINNQCEVAVLNDNGEFAYAKCSSWDFDNTTFISTLTSEFDLVCDKALWRVIYQSSKTFGSMVGDLLSGFLFDSYGRRKPSAIFAVFYVAVGLCASWLPTFEVIMAARIAIGICSPFAVFGFYTFAMEVCEPKQRSFVGLAVAVPFALGVMAWGGAAYLVRDWRWLLFVVVLPGLPFLLLVAFLDESPRWLIVNGRFEEALKVLEKAASSNGASLPPKDNLLNMMKDIESQTLALKGLRCGEKRNESFTRKAFNSVAILFRTPELRKIILVLYLNYACCYVVYRGLSIYGMIFDVNTFLYMVFTGLMEVPAYIITVPIITRFGRKRPTIFFYMVTAITLICIPILPRDYMLPVVILAMTGKFCISCVLQIIFVYAMELLPTQVRARGFGTSLLVAKFGTILTPLIIDVVGGIYPSLPSFIFGVLSVAAGLSTTLLPETLNRPLFETVTALEREREQGNNRLQSEGTVDDQEKLEP